MTSALPHLISLFQIHTSWLALPPGPPATSVQLFLCFLSGSLVLSQLGLACVFQDQYQGPVVRIYSSRSPSLGDLLLLGPFFLRAFSWGPEQDFQVGPEHLADKPLDCSWRPQVTSGRSSPFRNSGGWALHYYERRNVLGRRQALMYAPLDKSC